VQSLDRIRSPRTTPLARRQPGEGEQTVAGFLQAFGDGAVPEPPLADEGLAAGFNLLLGIGGHFVVQALGCMRQKVPVLVDLMPTSA
jgi:hypothetical protein